MRILSIGDNDIDIYMHSRMAYPGGNSVNYCVYAAQAEHEVALLTLFGNDASAEYIQSCLSAAGVNLSHSRYLTHKSNRCPIYFQDGDRSIIDESEDDIFRLYPIQLSQKDYEYISSFDIVHTSIYAQIDAQIQMIKQSGVFVVYDFSNLWTEELLDLVCPYLDIAFFSLGHMTVEEAKVFLRDVQQNGTRIAVGTRGADGALVYDGEVFFEKRAYELGNAPLDTLGAGDSFIAGFSLRYVDGLRYWKSLCKGGEFSLSDADLRDYMNILIQSALTCGNLRAVKTCNIVAAFDCEISVASLDLEIG